MAIDPERLKKAMLKKGFTAKEGGNHTKFILTHRTPGKPAVSTVMSRGGHGKEPFGPRRAAQYRRELGFESIDQLQEYADCTLTEEEYVGILRKQGLLNRKSVGEDICPVVLTGFTLNGLQYDFSYPLTLYPHRDIHGWAVSDDSGFFLASGNSIDDAIDRMCRGIADSFRCPLDRRRMPPLNL